MKRTLDRYFVEIQARGRFWGARVSEDDISLDADGKTR